MQADKNTWERTESAATVAQAMHGDSCSANRVDPDTMCSTSFGGDSTRSPALLCSRDDALVGNGTAAPKSCLSPLEMRQPPALPCRDDVVVENGAAATKSCLSSLEMR